MKYKFSIKGLDCPNCAAKLAAIIEREADVDSCKINFLTEKMTVESDLDIDELRPLVVKLATAFEDGIVVE